MPFGNPFESLPLRITGPASAGSPDDPFPLTILVPEGVPSGTTLFTQGPEAHFATLFIGKEIDSSGELPLYLQSPWAVGDEWPDATGTVAILPLSVSGCLWYPKDDSVPFFITTPSISSGIESVGLFASGNPGGISDEISVTISGAPPVPLSSSTVLLMPGVEILTSGTPLYIERGAGTIMPLSITSQIMSGVFPVSISGVNPYSSGTTLFINPPTPQSLTIFTRGFSDC